MPNNVIYHVEAVADVVLLSAVAADVVLLSAVAADVVLLSAVAAVSYFN
jgi:hypothetical protein